MMLVCRQVLIPQIITDNDPLQAAVLTLIPITVIVHIKFSDNYMLEAIYLTISPGHNGKSYDPLGTHAVNMKYLIMILV